MLLNIIVYYLGCIFVVTCRYSFDPRDLLVKILTVLVRMSNASEEREFVKCLAANPDYSRLSVERALRVVQRENLAPDFVVEDLRRIVQEVSVIAFVLFYKKELGSF